MLLTMKLACLGLRTATTSQHRSLRLARRRLEELAQLQLELGGRVSGARAAQREPAAALVGREIEVLDDDGVDGHERRAELLLVAAQQQLDVLGRVEPEEVGGLDAALEAVVCTAHAHAGQTERGASSASRR
jgi:hypothetical protein